MPPSIDDEPASDTKPPAKRMYYAIRKCDSLKAPAIFLHWDDCSFYVDDDENEVRVEYQSFDQMAEAIKYIESSEESSMNAQSDANHVSDETKIPATPRDQSAGTRDSENLDSKSKTKYRAAPVARASSLGRLKRSAEEASSSSPCGKKMKATTKLSPVAWMSKANGERVPLYAEADVIDLLGDGDEASSDVNVESTKAAPLITIKGEGKMQERFETKFEMLKEYKKVYGTCNVSNKRSVGRFSGLYNFFQFWRQKLKEQEPNNPKFVGEPNLVRLTALGMALPSTGRRAQWEQYFTLLAEYKEVHGTCVAPTNLESSSKFCTLHRWIYMQRMEMRSYEEDPATSKFDESQYTRLADLGLDKGKERKPAKLKTVNTSSWQEMFEELKQFVKMNGHANVPKRPRTTLQNWIALMHTHYDRLKEGKKSQLTAERIAQMVALGFAFDVKFDRMGFDDRALQWLEYKTKHGCDPTTTCGDGLGEWIRRMQRTYVKYNKGEKTLLSQNRIDKLNSWGFNWDITARRYTLPTEKIDWEERFEQVLLYKAAHGTCYIPQNHHELGTWVRGQRRAYNSMKAGKKSFISKAKLDRLEAVGFVFNPKNGGSRQLTDVGDDNDSGEESSSLEEEGDDEEPEDLHFENTHHAADRRGDHSTFAPWDRYTPGRL